MSRQARHLGTHTHNTYTTRVHIRFRPQLPFLYASVLSCYFPPLVPYPFSLLLLLTSYNIILHQEIKFEEKIRERKHCLVVFAINIFERRSYRELYAQDSSSSLCNVTCTWQTWHAIIIYFFSYPPRPSSLPTEKLFYARATAGRYKTLDFLHFSLHFILLVPFRDLFNFFPQKNFSIASTSWMM